MPNDTERIYVGGIDPDRGLTVELVASRLCLVKGVEVLSINDVAINNNTQHKTNAGGNKSAVVYKRTVVDEDGDIVDTRNFFFLEARCSTNSNAAIDNNNDDVKQVSTSPNPIISSSSSSQSPSALDILAKQYHSVKWKGCQLRVEAAKPHFLHRLEEERRAIASEKQERINAQQMLSNNNDDEEDDNDNDDKAEQTTKEEKVVKCRRRLRIRKRFGEEAYHVDTQPHPVDLSYQQTTTTTTSADADNTSGWDSFAFLHKRMKNKRHSQQQKLVERRKKERRLWARGGKGGEKNSNTDPQQQENDDLNALIFLNRAIHIRFSEDCEGRKDHCQEKEEHVTNVCARLELDHDDEESNSSSSAVSSDSDELSEQQGGDKHGYKWSDDEDENVAKDNDTSSEERKDDDSSSIEEGHAARTYAWSDDDNDDTMSSTTSNGQSSDDATSHKPKGRKKMMIDGSEYTKAVAIDEFSGGMDFDLAPDDAFEDTSCSSGEVDSSADTSQVCLEHDIKSNLEALSQLFPDEHFDKHPLAVSISNCVDQNDNGEGKQEHSVFGGAGLILQRYDPTKESSVKKYEVNKDGAKQPHKDDANSKSRVDDDASVSSEKSSQDDSTDKSLHKKDNESTSIDANTDKSVKKEKSASNIEGKIVQAKDVYEQDKLEGIFKQARDGKSESFSLGNLFQPDDKAQSQGDVYEQDELENVFKEARTDGGSSSGFLFGFQSEPPQENDAADSSSAPFSFGFNAVSSSKDVKEQQEQEHHNVVEKTTVVEEKPETKSLQKKRRRGTRFSECNLDKYEDMFFSMNEGVDILKDLDGMRQNDASQEQWQKERQVLTADWKRKQKSALSKKVKKFR